MGGCLKATEAQQWKQIETDFDLIFHTCLMDFGSLGVSKDHQSMFEIVFLNFYLNIQYSRQLKASVGGIYFENSEILAISVEQQVLTDFIYGCISQKFGRNFSELVGSASALCSSEWHSSLRTCSGNIYVL